MEHAIPVCIYRSICDNRDLGQKATCRTTLKFIFDCQATAFCVELKEVNKMDPATVLVLHVSFLGQRLCSNLTIKWKSRTWIRKIGNKLNKTTKKKLHQRCFGKRNDNMAAALALWWTHMYQRQPNQSLVGRGYTMVQSLAPRFNTKCTSEDLFSTATARRIQNGCRKQDGWNEPGSMGLYWQVTVYT